MIEPGCETNEWAHWTSCSVTCGKGISMRQRGYADSMKAKKMGCGRQLVQKEMCAAGVAYPNADGTAVAGYRATMLPRWEVIVCVRGQFYDYSSAIYQAP